MRTVRVHDAGVEDAAPGDRFLLLKESDDACLVRDPATGERRYLPADGLERVDGPPVAVEDAPEALRALAARDGRLGLLVDLVGRWSADACGDAADGTTGLTDDADPDTARATPVRTLLAETTLCESDLHGALADLEAAGLIDRVERENPLLGRQGRAYRPTERAREAVERLRS